MKEIMGFNLNKQFDYENGFHITCDNLRFGKLLAHYELYKMITDLPGDVIEIGVFKAVSFIRWLTYRNLLENENSRTVIGFDTFDLFPKTEYEKDQFYRERFIEIAGERGISIDELNESLKYKRLTNYQLVKGNIIYTLPDHFEQNPHSKIALLHMDADVYEPSKIALEYIWPRMVKGGVIILDDYGVFPGETDAVDEFFKNKEIEIKKLSISHANPSYIIKKEL
jgi:hypothetical protein